MGDPSQSGLSRDPNRWGTGEVLRLSTLSAGSMIEVRTRNTVYTIRIGDEGRIQLSGHERHCPDRVPVGTLGSVLPTGESCRGLLAKGIQMEFRIGYRRVITTRVESIAVLKLG